MEENIILTDVEKRVLDVLRDKEEWVSWKLKRISDKEFDIGVEGEKRLGNSTYGFSAWVPLSVIYNVDWTDHKVWKFSDWYGQKGYILAQGYDWSGIRDSSNDAIWKMFGVALRMMGIYVKTRR